MKGSATTLLPITLSSYVMSSGEITKTCRAVVPINNIMKVLSIRLLVLLLTYSSVSEQFEKKLTSNARFVDGDDLWSSEYNANNNEFTPGK